MAYLYAWTCVCIHQIYIKSMFYCWHTNSFETRPGPASWPGPGWWKNRKRHDPVWPGDPVDLAKPGCNPLTFFFFTKTTPFWIFFKIGIDSTDPVTRSKPGTQALDRAGFKNYGHIPYCFNIQCLCYHQNINLCIHQNYMKLMFYYWHIT